MNVLFVYTYRFLEEEHVLETPWSVSNKPCSILWKQHTITIFRASISVPAWSENQYKSHAACLKPSPNRCKAKVSWQCMWWSAKLSTSRICAAASRIWDWKKMCEPASNRPNLLLCCCARAELYDTFSITQCSTHNILKLSFKSKPSVVSVHFPMELKSNDSMRSET